MAPDFFDQAFQAWWREQDLCDARTIPEVARDAWRAAWKMAWAEAWKSAVAAREVDARHNDEPAERDWNKFGAEMREAAVLAERYGLVIQSVPGTNDKKVKATRKGKFVAETYGWSTMIMVLKDLGKQGKL